MAIWRGCGRFLETDEEVCQKSLLEMMTKVGVVTVVVARKNSVDGTEPAGFHLDGKSASATAAQRHAH